MAANLTVDNRDLAEINEYLESRIEALLKRNRELEAALAEMRSDWRAEYEAELEKMR